MAPPPAVIGLGVLMIVTGTINTIATKLQDRTVVGVDKEGAPVYFFAPGVQSAFMFLGEALCLAAHAWRDRVRSGGWGFGSSATPSTTTTRRLTTPVAASFALPAALDVVATTLINVGLFYSSASVYQMLRGTLAVFAALFTVLLLKRRLHVHHIFGVVLIASGAAIVGATSVLLSDSEDRGGVAALAALLPPPHPPPKPRPFTPSASRALLGDALIVGAQAATALQFIVEEKVLGGARVPAMAAVGLEGAWGLVICAVVLPILSSVHTRVGGGRAMDSGAALRQIAASPRLAASTTLSVVSMAAFNTLGIKITKRVSGASRAAADAARTLLVWGVSVALGWERVGGAATAVQALGFIVLLAGSALYNELVKGCLPRSAGAADGEGRDSSGGDPSDVETPLLPPPPPPPSRHRPRSAGAPVPAPRARHGGGGDSSYTLARSMRLFPPAALSPHPLASPSLGEPLLAVDIVGGGGEAAAEGGTSGRRGRVVWADKTPDTSGRGGRDAAAALAHARRGGGSHDGGGE